MPPLYYGGAMNLHVRPRANIEGFSKTIKFIWHHCQTRNFSCTAAEVTEVNFKTSACLFTFYGRNYVFAYGRWPNILHFCFKSPECTGNFSVCSLEVSLRIISFRCPFGFLVWNYFWSPVANCRHPWWPGAL